MNGTKAVDCFSEDTTRTDEGTGVKFFNVLNVTCCAKGLEDDRLDTLARAIHECCPNRGYPESDPAQPPSVESVVSWEQLPEAFRDSFRCQADHIDIKLRAVGAERHPLVADEQAGETPFEFTEEEIEALANMEHNRRCAEIRLSGWRYGATADSSRRISNSLVPWDALPENARQEARNTVTSLADVLARAGEGIRRSVS